MIHGQPVDILNRDVTHLFGEYMLNVHTMLLNMTQTHGIAEDIRSAHVVSMAGAVASLVPSFQGGFAS
jgi:hypothetical protein